MRARSRRYQPVPDAPKRAAIYCRISDDREETKVGVVRQEADCKETAKRLGYEVPQEFVFVDNSKSAWQRNRKRPGWDAMLELMKESQVDAVIAYHPDRLMRQPRDLEDLIDEAERSTERGRPVALVGTNTRDLGNPDDVFMLRHEINAAAKSSADTSRRVKRALVDNAKAGKVHGGRRAFGYLPGNMEIFEPEAAIIRDVAGRILNNEPVRKICRDLNEDGITTANGKQWSNATLWALMTGPRIAGLRQHQGEIAGVAQWPAIIDPSVWQALCANSDIRASTFNEALGETTRRYYLLRGLLRCAKCHGLLTGEVVHSQESYRCRKQIGTDRCGSLRIMAEPLEKLLVGAALSRLEHVQLSVRNNVVIDAEVEAENAKDKATLTQMAISWATGDMNEEGYHAAVKIIQERMAARLGAAPKAQRSLTGLAGPGVRAKWEELPRERQNAVLRDVFHSVTIHPAPVYEKFVDRGEIDTSRIEVVLAI